MTAVLEVNRNEDQFFCTAFRSFVSTIVDKTAHRLLMEYLRSKVKPQNMSVMEVDRRVQVLCIYAEDLPTESGQLPVPISEDERKTLFYYAGELEDNLHKGEFENCDDEYCADDNLFQWFV